MTFKTEYCEKHNITFQVDFEPCPLCTIECQDAKTIPGAIKIAEELRLILVPIEVYDNEAKWDRPEPHDKPIATWWCTIPYASSSIYLPLDEYKEEWGNWITNIDELIETDKLAETLPEAIRLGALKMFERIKKREENYG